MHKNYIGKALIVKKRKRFVSVARLVEQKNQKMLINAFAKFHNTHPEYHLTIYGEGPFRQNLETLIKATGKSQYIELAGTVNDIWDRILDAECFVLTSNFEGMPNALLEAMCLGLPCISTKVSGAVDLINNEENGLLININDTDELVSQMTYLVDNPDIRVQLGKQASLLHKVLNVDAIVKQWENYIKRIVNSKR